MKIDYEDLDDSKKLGKGEQSIDRPEPATTTYDYRVDQAIRKFGISLAPSMRDALTARSKGVNSFTKREIDTLLRHGVDFNNEFLIEALKEFQGMIYEGVSIRGITSYQLRKRYNDGVRKRKTKRYRYASDDDKEVFEKIMLGISDDLTACGLPIWDSEIERGFPVELTKPEWMTWGQWQKNFLKVSFTPIEKSEHLAK